MANRWHVAWLDEGVQRWNDRRKKVNFAPDLSGVRFFDRLPPDYRDSPKTSRYFEKIDLSGSNLSGADLSGLNFQKANFSHADLSDADMAKSNFVRANFNDADLSNADISKSILDFSTFERTSLKEVSFEDAHLDGAIFVESQLSKKQTEIAKSKSARIYSDKDSYISEKSESSSRYKPTDDTYRITKGEDDRTPKYRYDVFYGTNRTRVLERGALVDFGGDLHDDLSYGVCEVIIPKERKVGSLGSPRWKRFFSRVDDRVRLGRMIQLNRELYWVLFKDVSRKMKVKEKPTIFVHGYNTSFKDSVVRAAQIGFDIGLGQGIGLFSWPSKGNILKYSADETSSEASKYTLADFIQEYVEHSNQKSINIIAHSMGCRCVLGAIEVLSRDRKEIIKSINQIILAAADVDTAIMPKLGANAVKYASRTTSYISDKDRALKVSGWLHSFPRVGLTPPTFILNGMDTVLVNNLYLGDFSHGYLGSSRTILSDIFDIFKTNSPPEDRHAIETVSLSGQKYWRIKE